MIDYWIETLRGKIRDRGLLWTLRRSAAHVWNVAARRGESELSWKLLTGTTPKLGLVNVEITTYCNLHCAGCQRTIHASNGGWTNRHITVAQFEKIVNELPSSDEFIPQGIGEPTLHPALPQLIAIARQAGKFNRIALTTHGMARDLEYFEQLFASGLSKLFVSVDSLDPALAEELRAGTNVEKLKERLRDFSRRFPGKIGVRVTTGTRNIDDIPALLGELNQLGKFEVALHPYDDVGDPRGCLSLQAKADFLNRLAEVRDLHDNLKISASGFVPSDEICHWPWKSPSITVNGDVTPCCRIMYHNVMSFGNVFDSSFDEVWNSESTEQWRQQFRQSTPDVCAGCPWFTHRNAGGTQA